ncbi:MAG TPA: hypothetical protein VGO13_09700 [Solirubrobacterales bacterium]|nr:hypothetical protein [Solirubrobacterales bacterium]
MPGDERGQSTVEWVGTLGVVALLLVGLVAVGVRAPGVSLAQVLASKLLCAASLADGCGDEPVLIAAYGSEVGEMVREYMPMLAFEEGSRAVPVDYRRCRDPSCGDASEDGLVHRTDAGLAVTAFVHVIDCRGDEAEVSAAAGADCSGSRAGNLYLQYWTYYADSATLRDIPIAGEEGFHQDDWEGVQIRVGPDGGVDERASSHNGYNYALSAANWGSDAGLDVVKDAAEGLGVRAENGWGPARGLLLVSGGSHAGNAGGIAHVDRFTPGRRVHLIPLEPIAATDGSTFAISPPWEKKVWLDPEATGTD